MWNSVQFTFVSYAAVAFGLLSLYLTFRLPKEHCVCGIKVPEFGGMCECGDYNGRIVIKIDGKDELREQELRRIEEEKRKGNDYDTFL